MRDSDTNSLRHLARSAPSRGAFHATCKRHRAGGPVGAPERDEICSFAVPGWSVDSRLRLNRLRHASPWTSSGVAHTRCRRRLDELHRNRCRHLDELHRHLPVRPCQSSPELSHAPIDPAKLKMLGPRHEFWPVPSERLAGLESAPSGTRSAGARGAMREPPRSLRRLRGPGGRQPCYQPENQDVLGQDGSDGRVRLWRDNGLDRHIVGTSSSLGVDAVQLHQGAGHRPGRRETLQAVRKTREVVAGQVRRL